MAGRHTSDIIANPVATIKDLGLADAPAPAGPIVPDIARMTRLIAAARLAGVPDRVLARAIAERVVRAVATAEGRRA